MRILEGGLDRPDVLVLLARHVELSRSVSPAASAHVFDIARLAAPDIRFWTAREEDTGPASEGGLLGVGALKRLGPHDGEIKSMHVAERARRRGIGAAMVRWIVAAAEADGVRRVYLETGAFDYFAPARALYAACGFVEVPPFGDYAPDPNSVFMMQEIGSS